MLGKVLLLIFNRYFFVVTIRDPVVPLDCQI